MFGIPHIQQDIENDYSVISVIVYQYDHNTDSIIAATNQLEHYPSVGAPTNTMA